MAPNIKDVDADRLATEVAAMTGESKTRAVKVALAERRPGLEMVGSPDGRRERLRTLLEDEYGLSSPRACAAGGSRRPSARRSWGSAPTACDRRQLGDSRDPAP